MDGDLYVECEIQSNIFASYEKEPQKRMFHQPLPLYILTHRRED